VVTGRKCVERAAEASKSAASVDEKRNRYVSEGRESRAECSSKRLSCKRGISVKDSNNGYCEGWVSSDQDPKSAATAIHPNGFRAAGLGRVVHDEGRC
jgi:hypothetical protein